MNKDQAREIKNRVMEELEANSRYFEVRGAILTEVQRQAENYGKGDNWGSFRADWINWGLVAEEAIKAADNAEA